MVKSGFLNEKAAILGSKKIFEPYGKRTLAYLQYAGINGTVLTKANLLKGRDAKLPIYGLDLR